MLTRAALALLLAAPFAAGQQTADPLPASPAATVPLPSTPPPDVPGSAEAAPAEAQPELPLATDQELERLLGPLALYPDPLIALILPAATMPSDVVIAARFLRNRPGADREIDEQRWEDAVKMLARYPTVIAWLDENLEWTKEVGEAFVRQPADVMTAIQRLRARARAAGTLVDGPEQVVRVEEDCIRILPATPHVIYVPTYDPAWVFVSHRPYYTRPLITFSVGFAVGHWLAYDCDWRYRTVRYIYRPERPRVWVGYHHVSAPVYWSRPHGYADPYWRTWAPPPSRYPGRRYDHRPGVVGPGSGRGRTEGQQPMPGAGSGRPGVRHYTAGDAPVGPTLGAGSTRDVSSPRPERRLPATGPEAQGPAGGSGLSRPQRVPNLERTGSSPAADRGSAPIPAGTSSRPPRVPNLERATSAPAADGTAAPGWGDASSRPPRIPNLDRAGSPAAGGSVPGPGAVPSRDRSSPRSEGGAAVSRGYARPDVAPPRESPVRSETYARAESAGSRATGPSGRAREVGPSAPAPRAYAPPPRDDGGRRNDQREPD